MTRFLLTLCCAFFAGSLFAQHDSIPADSLKGRSPYTKFKKEFSFDIRGILYAAPMASVTYRVRYGEKRRINLYNKKVFRLFGNGYFGFPFNDVTRAAQIPPNSNSYYYSSEPFEQHYSDINLFAGLEKQHFFGRLVFYRGLELGGGWSDYSSKYFYANSYRQDLTNMLRVTETKAFLSGFVGLKYFLVPQISLSVECNAYCGVTFLHQSFDYYIVDSISGTSFIPTRTDKYEQDPILKINGLRALNIGYHF